VIHYSLVKTAADDRGERQLAREAQWLRELAAMRELEGQVPRLLEEGRNGLRGHRLLRRAQPVARAARGLCHAGHARNAARRLP
jgi:hypothetical protein